MTITRPADRACNHDDSHQGKWVRKLGNEERNLDIFRLTLTVGLNEGYGMDK